MVFEDAGEEGRRRRRRGKGGGGGRRNEEEEICGIKIARYRRKIKTNDANLRNDDPESRTRRARRGTEGGEAQGVQAEEKVVA